jgi:hypothetical protein
MKEIQLIGLDGATPLGFLAAIGTLASCRGQSPATEPALRWVQAPRWTPVLSGDDLDPATLLARLEEDRLRCLAGPLFGTGGFAYRYPKVEKGGNRTVRGLRMPLAVYRHLISAWAQDGDVFTLDQLAGLSTDARPEALEEKKRCTTADLDEAEIGFAPGLPLELVTVPTMLDFTARNEQFLEQIEKIGQALTIEHMAGELMDTAIQATLPVPSLRWSQDAEAPAALFPRGASSSHPAKEWFAFRALSILPTYVAASGPTTLACQGRRKNGTFTWGLWAGNCSLQAVRSLLAAVSLSDQSDGFEDLQRGLVARFCAALTKTADGYGGALAPTQAL